MARTVLFDVDGVLIHGYHTRPERQQRWDETMLEDLGIDPEAFKQQFIRGVFVNEVLVGRKHLVDALDETLPCLGYRGSPLTLVDYWLRNDSKVNVELFETARALSRHEDVALYVATNQEHLRASYLWAQLGFGDVFREMFYAARLGTTKPNVGFFDAIMARLGPQDEPPLLFDDSHEVIEAANAYGWEGVLFNTHPDCREHPFIAERIRQPLSTSKG